MQNAIHKAGEFSLGERKLGMHAHKKSAISTVSAILGPLSQYFLDQVKLLFRHKSPFSIFEITSIVHVMEEWIELLLLSNSYSSVIFYVVGLSGEYQCRMWFTHKHYIPVSRLLVPAWLEVSVTKSFWYLTQLGLFIVNHVGSLFRCY